MWAAKISTAMLHWRIERNGHTLSTRLKISVAIALIWGLVSVFLIAFQCSPPAPWTHFGSSCTTSGPTQYTVIALNMASDVWLALAPLPTLSQLQTTWDRKRRVMCLLGMRLLVPCLCIGQVIAVSRTISSTDKTWARSIQVVWEIIVTFFSVICSVVPRTQSFWAGLQSGRAHVEDRDDFELSKLSGTGGSKYNRSGNSRDEMRMSQQQRSKDRRFARASDATKPAARTSEDSERALFPLRPDQGKSLARVHGGATSAFNADEGDGQVHDLSHGILQTTEVTVQRS